MFHHSVYKNGITSLILRTKLYNSSVTTQAGLTGLTNASSGLIIATIADNEATTTAYTAAGSTIDTISTLGTFAAPTSGHCRFKEVDATNHPGVYEIQIADARWAVSNARYVIVSVLGATNLAQQDIIVQLWGGIDPQDGVHAGITGIPNAAAGASGGIIINGSNSGALTEGYSSLHSAPTFNQLLYEIRSILAEKSVSGTTVTTKKVDGSTTAETFTLNDASAPTSITRAS